MPKVDQPAASAAAETVVLKADQASETLPADAAQALVASGAAEEVAAPDKVALVLLKPLGDFAAGRVVRVPQSAADPHLADKSARLATDAEIEIAWPFVAVAETL